MTVKLTWIDLNPNFSNEGYRVYRSEEPFTLNTAPAPIANLGTGYSEWYDNDHDVSETYYYAVASVHNGVTRPTWISKTENISTPSLPYWTPENFQLYFDFSSDLAWKESVNAAPSSLVSDVHTTPVTVRNSNGYISTVAANTLSRTDYGLQTRPARTNLCLNYSANVANLTAVSLSSTGLDPNTVLTVVDDADALAAAGLDGLCSNGKVYRIDNSTGVVNSQAVILTSNNYSEGPATVSMWVRGFGIGRVRNSSQTVPYSNLTPNYTRMSFTNASTPVSNGACRIQVGSGSVAYFVLNQFEVGSFPSAPIVTAGNTATSDGNLLTYDISNRVKNGLLGVVKFTAETDVDGVYVFRMSDGTMDNEVALKNVSGNLVFQVTSNTVPQASISLGPMSLGVQTVVFAVDDGYAKARKVGSSDVASNTSIEMPALTRLGFGGDGIGTANNSQQSINKLALRYGLNPGDVGDSSFALHYAQVEQESIGPINFSVKVL